MLYWLVSVWIDSSWAATHGLTLCVSKSIIFTAIIII